MTPTPFAPKRLSRTSDTIDLLRLIVFEVAGYWLALPVSSVIKVINAPPILAQSPQGIGMVDLGMKSITVVDLHYRFAATPAPPARFLILTLSRHRELFGIPAPQVPELLEIPLESIRPLPPSYRQVDALGIASHMAILSSENSSIQVYLLGLQHLLEMVIPS